MELLLAAIIRIEQTRECWEAEGDRMKVFPLLNLSGLLRNTTVQTGVPAVLVSV